MSVDPLDELFEDQEKMRTTGSIGMDREREHEPVMLPVEIREMRFPEFESRSSVDKTVRVRCILDKHVRWKIVEVLEKHYGKRMHREKEQVLSSPNSQEWSRAESSFPSREASSNPWLVHCNRSLSTYPRLEC